MAHDTVLAATVQNVVAVVHDGIAPQPVARGICCPEGVPRTVHDFPLSLRRKSPEGFTALAHLLMV